jgi:hypothetical protein
MAHATTPGSTARRQQRQTVAEFGAWFMAGADLPAEERALAARHRQAGSNAAQLRRQRHVRHPAGRYRRGLGRRRRGRAGINCVGLSPNGRRARFGSLGAITGDWGGGADIGMAALGAAVRAEEGRIGPTRLRRDVPDHFQRRRASDVAVDVHQGKLHQRRLRELAPVVVAAAQANDEAAIEILERQADEVISFVVAAIRRLHLTRLDVPVVLGGGIMTALSPRFVSRIEAGVQRVAPTARCTVCYDRPIVGAALAALDLAGADHAATARVRATLNDGRIRQVDM